MGFGAVTEINGTLHIDGRDTTTCANDVAWKYIAEQILEQNENGFVHAADYYETITPAPPIQEQINTLAYLMGV